MPDPASKLFRPNGRPRIRNGAICFLHIPKTAGTSLLRAFGEHFSPSAIFPSHHVSDLVQVAPEEFGQTYRFVATHAGVEYVWLRAETIVTVLRDPVARILSLYNYWRGQPIESATVFQNGVVDPVIELARTLDFEAFIHSDHPRLVSDLRDGQTFQLTHSASIEARKLMHTLSNAEVLAIADRNLRAMEAVGTTENLSEFAQTIQRKLGLELRIRRLNVTAKPAMLRDKLGSDALARLHELTECDRTLHDRAASGVYAEAADLWAPPVSAPPLVSAPRQATTLRKRLSLNGIRQALGLPKA